MSVMSVSWMSMAAYGMVAPVLSVAVFPRDILTIAFIDGRMEEWRNAEEKREIEKKMKLLRRGHLGTIYLCTERPWGGIIHLAKTAGTTVYQPGTYF
jgi:hypothetical protein